MLTLSSPSTARRRTVELRISFTVLPVEIIINESAIFPLISGSLVQERWFAVMVVCVSALTVALVAATLFWR
jgi:hypothetical protein